MDYEAFKNICRQTVQAIAERRLVDALALSESIIWDIFPPSPFDTLLEIRSDYEALLRFAAQGGNDEHLDDSLYAIVRRTIALLHDITILWRIGKSDTPTFARYADQHDSADSSIRETQLMGNIMYLSHANDDTQEYYDAVDTAFDKARFWLLTNNADTSLVGATAALPRFARLTIVSAFTVGCLDSFCEYRLRILLRLAQRAAAEDEDDEDYRVRLLMGLTLIHRQWHMLIDFYPDICEEMHTLFAENAETARRINEALVRAAVTERVEGKLDEFMPAIGKIIKKQMKFLDDSDDSKPIKTIRINMSDLGKDEKKITELFSRQAQRMEELRHSGFDTDFSSFKLMTKSFAFFKTVAHFFYPFVLKYPFVKHTLEEQGTPKLTLSIIKDSRLCDTSSYSYVSMLNFLSEKSASMAQMLNEAMSQIEDISDMPDAYRDLNAYDNYAQMMYRYCNTSQQPEQPHNVMQLSADTLMPTLPMFADIFLSYEDVRPTIETLLWMQAPAEALTIITSTQERTGANAQLLCQKGKALMSLEMWQRAIEALSQARLLDDSDDEITYEKAQCHQALGQWQAAVTELESMLHDEPQPDISEQLAYCLIKLERWDDAANRLFQLEFEGNSSKNIKRAIGWCALHQGKFTRAEQYYDALVQSRNARWEDCLNLGHALWLQDKRSEAIEAYATFAKAFAKAKNKQSFAFWQEAFREDARTLLATHTSPNQLAILLEVIAMKSAETSGDENAPTQD